MKTISQICKECKEIFQAQSREVNRGNAKYCSKKCSKIGVSKTHLERNAKINIPNVECSYCHVMFYKNNSKKKTSKSNLHFCCREHKDLAQSYIKEIQPHHYGTGVTKYRDKAFKNLPNYCAICGYANKYALEVHHIDRNRTNNDISNLLILCANCHTLEHKGKL